MLLFLAGRSRSNGWDNNRFFLARIRRPTLSAARASRRATDAMQKDRLLSATLDQHQTSENPSGGLLTFSTATLSDAPVAFSL
jgi:hypothetical protein